MGSVNQVHNIILNLLQTSRVVGIYSNNYTNMNMIE